MSDIIVSSGQVSSGIILNSNDSMTVLNGGTANVTTIYRGGSMTISGGTANTVVVNSSGEVTVSEGGTINGISGFFDGHIYISNGGVISTGDLRGATATVVSGGTICGFMNSGNYNRTGGDINLQKGGYGHDLTILSNGDLYISAGAYAEKIQASSGGHINLGNDGYSHMYNQSWGSAADILIHSNGELHVGLEGMASQVTIEDGGRVYISSGGTTKDTVVHAGGSMFISSGGTASAITENGGFVDVAAGASANFTENSFSGLVLNEGQSATLHSGTTLISGNVNSGGKIIVFDGGKITNTTLAYGDADESKREKLLVHQGGVAENINVSNGCDFLVFGYVSNTILSGHRAGDAGDLSDLFVRSGGFADDTTVYNGGHFYIHSATAKNLTISSGGTAEIREESVVSNVSITHGGSLGVYQGTLFNTCLSSGGVMYVSSGGMISGTLQIEDGAKVSAYTGAIIDFTVSEQTDSKMALINNWSLISGGANANYTVTVKTNQTNGIYTLAEGASDFTNTITVKTVDNITLGTLAVEETKIFKNVSYVLSKNDNTLSLSVTALTKSDVDGNGISDVMFQYTGGDYQIGFWMNGSNTWQGQGIAQDPDFKLIGAYDMDANGKADALMIGSTSNFGHPGIFVGYYLDGSSSDWKTIGYLDNPGNVKWENAIGNLTGNSGCNSLVWHAPELGALGVWTDGTANWVSLGSAYNENWVMQGCGDFDGNGKDEVLFTYEGNLYSIDIDGNFAALGQGVNGWDVRAIGDFSGDGQDDIVLFHTETGSVMKFENGTTYQNLGQLDASDWFIAGCGDYNGDQKDDLLVRQNSSGMLGYYESGDLSKWVELGRGIDSNWTVVA